MVWRTELAAYDAKHSCATYSPSNGAVLKGIYIFVAQEGGAAELGTHVGCLRVCREILFTTYRLAEATMQIWDLPAQKPCCLRCFCCPRHIGRRGWCSQRPFFLVPCLKLMAWPGPVLPYISNVLVHPQVRRRGLANRLMLRCEEQAREWGFGQVGTIL